MQELVLQELAPVSRMEFCAGKREGTANFIRARGYFLNNRRYTRAYYIIRHSHYTRTRTHSDTVRRRAYELTYRLSKYPRSPEVVYISLVSYRVDDAGGKGKIRGRRGREVVDRRGWHSP